MCIYIYIYIYIYRERESERERKREIDRRVNPLSLLCTNHVTRKHSRYGRTSYSTPGKNRRKCNLVRGMPNSLAFTRYCRRQYGMQCSAFIRSFLIN